MVFPFFASDRFKDRQITISNYFDCLASSLFKLYIGGQIQGNYGEFLKLGVAVLSACFAINFLLNEIVVIHCRVV